MHQLHGHFAGDLVAKKDGGCIRQHHAKRRSHHDLHHIWVARGQCHGCDLGLVSHLSQEEGQDSSAEGAVRVLGLCGIVLDLVGNHHPRGHGEKRDADGPAENVRPQCLGYPAAHCSCGCVIDDGGGEDPRDDLPRFPESGGQNDCQQLGLVTHLTEHDNAGGYEKCFHGVGIPGPDMQRPHHIPGPIRRRCGQWSCQAMKLRAPWPVGQVC